MKKLWITAAALFLAFGLTACATTGVTDKHTVKCPSCGYEFVQPLGG